MLAIVGAGVGAEPDHSQGSGTLGHIQRVEARTQVPEPSSASS